MNQSEKRKRICQLIDDVYDSLQSHMPASYDDVRRCDSCGGRDFHIQCIKDYADQIKRLSELL